jgi:hypothetical protein
MTARDELQLKSPDALLNGEAVKTVLRNCVPDVNDVSEIPTIDLDAILVAIRMATYGDEMEMEVTHKCSEETSHDSKVNLNLGQLLDTITYHSGEPVEIRMPNGLLAEIRPYTMSDRNKISMASWEQMSRMQQVDATETDVKKKMAEAGTSVSKLIDVTLDVVSNSVVCVTTPDGERVTDRKFIKEWVINLEKSDFNILDIGIKALLDVGIAKTVALKCDGCGETFSAPINFNPTDFFE